MKDKIELEVFLNPLDIGLKGGRYISTKTEPDQSHTVKAVLTFEYETVVTKAIITSSEFDKAFDQVIQARNEDEPLRVDDVKSDLKRKLFRRGM